MSSLLNLFGTDNVVLTVIVALAAVLLLIVLGVWALKLVFNATGRAARGRAKRLGVVDVTPVDQKRQLVLIRRDNTEHLLLIGGPQDVVVETGIEAEGATTRFGRQAASPQPQPQPAQSPPPQPSAQTPMAPAPAGIGRRTRQSNLPPDLTAMREPQAPTSGSLRNTGFMRADERREPDFIPSAPPAWSSSPDDSDTPLSVLPVPDDIGIGPVVPEKGDEPDLERDSNESSSGDKEQKG